MRSIINENDDASVTFADMPRGNADNANSGHENMNRHLKVFTAFRYIYSHIPRIEVVILVVAFLWTTWSKLLALSAQVPHASCATSMAVVLPDMVFFLVFALLASTLVWWRPGRWSVRCVLSCSVIILLWTIVNSAWLLFSGVQLQPAVLEALVDEFSSFWPMARVHVERQLGLSLMLVATLAAAGLAFVWRIIRPVEYSRDRSRHLRRVIFVAAGTAISAIIWLAWPTQSVASSSVDVLSFSTHWYALTSILTGNNERLTDTPRCLPCPASQQNADKASTLPDPMPNIVLLLLESTSYSACSLSDPSNNTTPCLRKLALEGVEFTNTHVPVSHTTDAIWSANLAIRPDLGGDNVEAVLRDEPIWGLPMLLKRHGYRTAFFEMSKGSFECAPGLMANLGFDWAWFRENLQDPSAYLGYLSGDDYQMLEPAFNWACSQSSPFLLEMITTASHDPFHVPAWYGTQQNTREEDYRQALRFTDGLLCRLREELHKRNIEHNTILCVIGDHGESFRDQGKGSRWVPNEEVMRVPFVIYWPEHTPKGHRITWPCSQLDVAPTLAKLVGLELAGPDTEGIDAMQPVPQNRRLYFSSFCKGSPRGYLEGDEKYVYWPYNDKLFLYDLWC